MAFATGSDPLILAVIWTGTGALGLALAMLLAIALLRVRLLMRLAHQRRFAARWQPLFAACVDGVPEPLPRLAPADGALFLKHWIVAGEAMRGMVQDHLVELAHRAGAARVAVHMLAGGKPQDELVALVALGHLRLPSLAPLAEALLQVPSPVISLEAAHALLRVDAPAHLRRVIAVAGRRPDWPVSRVLAMLQECGGELGGALTAALDAEREAGGKGLPRLLRLLPAAPAEEMRDAVLAVLAQSSSAEVLAAAAETLWHPEDAPHARRLASHPQWFVRLAATKALGRLGTAEDQAQLMGLLSDPSWWVRYRAAQALARLPGMDRGALERLRVLGDDQFAGDMLAQVLAEGAAP